MPFASTAPMGSLTGSLPMPTSAGRSSFVPPAASAGNPFAASTSALPSTTRSNPFLSGSASAGNPFATPTAPAAATSTSHSIGASNPFSQSSGLAALSMAASAQQPAAPPSNPFATGVGASAPTPFSMTPATGARAALASAPAAFPAPMSTSFTPAAAAPQSRAAFVPPQPSGSPAAPRSSFNPSSMGTGAAFVPSQQMTTPMGSFNQPGVTPMMSVAPSSGARGILGAGPSSAQFQAAFGAPAAGNPFLSAGTGTGMAPPPSLGAAFTGARK